MAFANRATSQAAVRDAFDGMATSVDMRVPNGSVNQAVASSGFLSGNAPEPGVTNTVTFRKPTTGGFDNA